MLMGLKFNLYIFPLVMYLYLSWMKPTYVICFNIYKKNSFVTPKLKIKKKKLYIFNFTNIQIMLEVFLFMLYLCPSSL